jgi:hypothetical protein
MRAVRSQQHGRAVCGQRPLREKKVFFGDFLSPDKKLPASRRIAEALAPERNQATDKLQRTEVLPPHPSPPPDNCRGRGSKHKPQDSGRSYLQTQTTNKLNAPKCATSSSKAYIPQSADYPYQPAKRDHSPPPRSRPAPASDSKSDPCR